MSFARSQTVTFANDLLYSKGNIDTLGKFYDDIIQELGATELLADKQSIGYQSSNSYLYPVTAIALLALIFDDRELYKTTLAELEAFSSSWRDMRGTPSNYVQDEYTHHTFRLFPAPDTVRQSAAIYGLSAIFSFSPDTIDEWLALPIALDMVSREAAMPSDHQDEALSQIAAQLAKLFYSFIGVSK